MAAGVAGWFEAHGLSEPEMDSAERALRDRFVAEYLYDGNPRLAAIRCGFSNAVAQDYANRFLNETYVLLKIKEMRTQVDRETFDPYARTEVLMGLRDEAIRGASSSARVSAWSKLATILGMDSPQKLEVTHRGGVIVVPGIAKAEDWEEAAVLSQQQLVTDARSDIA